MKYSVFTSESVCAGHPDKICDQISDSVVDAAISIYPKSRVACETLVTTNKIVLAGEVTCPKSIDFEKLARNKVEELGYLEDKFEFNNKASIEVYIHQQSPDIALGVDDGGAGDQGMMFGYACNETKQFMPLPITIAHELCQKMDTLHSKYVWLRPDGKSEVAVNYENGKVKSIKNIVLAKPFDYSKIDNTEVKKVLFDEVISPVLEKYKMNLIPIDEFVFNGTGKWEIGGPASDTGVTGRKIVVDTYGGMARIGGGCFSGKDTTKVDRSAAYAARYIAKNIVAAGLADRCEVQLAYVIGCVEPIVRAIETFDTANKALSVIEDFAWNLLDLSVDGINQGLDLRQAIYQKTARYGHFGNESYPWEKIKG
ncbi:MAG: methionine adenosyltransferase [Candidatus Shapirobacteria bacterium]|nr:methionine adenosyltransferase [Candidatus Shapirobacteria bacterium]